MSKASLRLKDFVFSKCRCVVVYTDTFFVVGQFGWPLCRWGYFGWGQFQIGPVFLFVFLRGTNLLVFVGSMGSLPYGLALGKASKTTSGQVEKQEHIFFYILY